MAQQPFAEPPEDERLSPWWPRAVGAVVVVGFTILIALTIKVHRDAPPIPERVVDSAGAVVFTGEDIMMGVFGMLAIALLVFSVRHVSTEPEWPYVKVSFWGLNIGLAMMVAFSLFPGGVLQPKTCSRMATGTRGASITQGRTRRG